MYRNLTLAMFTAALVADYKVSRRCETADPFLGPTRIVVIVPAPAATSAPLREVSSQGWATAVVTGRSAFVFCSWRLPSRDPFFGPYAQRSVMLCARRCMFWPGSGGWAIPGLSFHESWLPALLAMLDEIIDLFQTCLCQAGT